MKIVIVNKSDSTGGAAVVSRRLMEALRARGADARMLVAEKLSDSPRVERIASAPRLKLSFIADRLAVALANGFDRRTLFKIDCAACGIDISSHPLVKEADAVIINWINQGVLSLKGIRRLAESGKRIIWTMHDMWNFTGVCHHAGHCERFMLSAPCGGRCGSCPLLGSHASPRDISFRINMKKERLYEGGGIHFVAVSNWLAEKARASRLLHDSRLSVIPNAFPLPDSSILERRIPADSEKINLIFGAARIDDPIKDFPTLIESLRLISRKRPDLAKRLHLNLYGGIKDPSLIGELPVATTYHGVIRDSDKIINLYLNSHIVISTSLWETLPGTLVEGQTYGCWPVAFNAGGQSDIIDNGLTGTLVNRSPDPAPAMAEAIINAADKLKDSTDIPLRLYKSVARRFSANAIADAYLTLISNP